VSRSERGEGSDACPRSQLCSLLRRPSFIRAIANPFVHGPVALAVALSAVAALFLSARWAVRSLYAFLASIDESASSSGGSPASKQAPRRSKVASGAVPTPPLPPPASDDGFECDPPAWEVDGGGPRSTPLWIGFATLWLGYMANLVPYELIERSKFICEQGGGRAEGPLS